MPDSTTTVATTPKSHTGWHAFWGVIGAALGLAALAVVVGAGIFFYNNYVPMNAHNQVQAEVQQLRSTVQKIESHVPQVRSSGVAVKYGIGADDQPQRTVAKTDGIYDELHGDITALAAVVKSQVDGQKIFNDNLTANIANIAAEVRNQGSMLKDAVKRIDKLETAQAIPAPAQPALQPVVPAPAPQPVAPGPTSQAAPVQPAQQVADNGGKEVDIPNGKHITHVYRQGNADSCFTKHPGYKLVIGDRLGRAPDGHTIHLFDCVPKSDPRPARVSS